MIISILMHYYDNIGLNGLKSPAQRSGQFSELGSAQLSSNILGSCWTLEHILCPREGSNIVNVVTLLAFKAYLLDL